MGFYSSLILAANEGVRVPSAEEVQVLFAELGLIEPERASLQFGNLADEIIALFKDEEARKVNESFFCPDTISFHDKIEISDPDDDYDGKGWCFSIHGQGYFFPWDRDAIRSRVLQTPKLTRLREVLAERFGGRFVFPRKKEALLSKRLIDGTDGWGWFTSESM